MLWYCSMSHYGIRAHIVGFSTRWVSSYIVTWFRAGTDLVGGVPPSWATFKKIRPNWLFSPRHRPQIHASSHHMQWNVQNCPGEGPLGPLKRRPPTCAPSRDLCPPQPGLVPPAGTFWIRACRVYLLPIIQNFKGLVNILRRVVVHTWKYFVKINGKYHRAAVLALVRHIVEIQYYSDHNYVVMSVSV